jgi:hypothetical protein
MLWCRHCFTDWLLQVPCHVVVCAHTAQQHLLVLLAGMSLAAACAAQARVQQKSHKADMCVRLHVCVALLWWHVSRRNSLR